jgi:hypothetical protein
MGTLPDRGSQGSGVPHFSFTNRLSRQFSNKSFP